MLIQHCFEENMKFNKVIYWLFHITNSGPIYETLAFNSVDLVYPECKLGFADSFTRKVGLHKAHI